MKKFLKLGLLAMILMISFTANASDIVGRLYDRPLNMPNNYTNNEVSYYYYAGNKALDIRVDSVNSCSNCSSATGQTYTTLKTASGTKIGSTYTFLYTSSTVGGHLYHVFADSGADGDRKYTYETKYGTYMYYGFYSGSTLRVSQT